MAKKLSWFDAYKEGPWAHKICVTHMVPPKELLGPGIKNK